MLPPTTASKGSVPPSRDKVGSLLERKIACFYPWMPFEGTGAWSRFESMWKFFLEQGAEVTLALLGGGKEARLRNLSARFHPSFQMLGTLWNLGDRLAASGGRTDLRGLSKAELSLLLMYEKTLYTESPESREWFSAIIAEHDVITCEYPMLLPTLAEFCQAGKKPLIGTAHDALFELHGSTAMGRENLRKKEIESLRLAEAVVFCTERERKLFESFQIRGSVVLNTGDTRGISPGEDLEARKAVLTQLSGKVPHYVLFVGSDHGPNLEAVAEIKQIGRNMPEVLFVIAGNCAPRGVDGNVVALGIVTESQLDLLYRGASVVAIPLMRGTGSSVKTYQAFNYGKAVVSTPVGARGFATEHERELLLAPKPADFPAALRRLLADPSLRQRLGRNARAYAEQLDFRVQFQPYATLVEKLAGPLPVERSAVLRPRSLMLVDNNLGDRVGHHFNYAVSLREACESMGFGFGALIKSSAEPEVLRELDGTPAFAQGIHERDTQNPYPADWGALRGMYDFLGANDAFARSLEKSLQGRISAGDVVFLPNATPRQILGLALLLRNQPLFRLLRYVVLLRYSVNLAVGPLHARKSFLDRETAERYAFCFEKLVAAAPIGTVRLVTDSSELAKEYLAIAKRAIEVLPIPHTTAESSVAPVEGVPAKTPGKLRVVFLGDARDEKGFELLPPVAKFFSQPPWTSQVEFVFQAFVSHAFHLPMGATIEELAQLHSPNLHLVRSSLSVAAYQTLLLSADVVLLPYDALTYRARTSGPFVEAICANKPVVVPAQSWMSGLLENSGAGKTFVSGDSGSLVNALTELLREYASYSESAYKLGESFRAFHNPQNFVRELMKV
jgi:glycosyltransferase involved in cell wall biosynthesis